MPWYLSEKADGLANVCYVSDDKYTHKKRQIFSDSWAANWFGIDAPERSYKLSLLRIGI